MNFPPLPSAQTGALQNNLFQTYWYSWFAAIFQALNGPFQLSVYTVATLPSAANAGQLIYVSNAAGGATPAFSDGTNWRKVYDRNIVT